MCTCSSMGVKFSMNLSWRSSKDRSRGIVTINEPENSVCRIVWLTFSILQFRSKRIPVTAATIPGRSCPRTDRMALFMSIAPDPDKPEAIMMNPPHTHTRSGFHFLSTIIFCQANKRLIAGIHINSCLTEMGGIMP